MWRVYNQHEWLFAVITGVDMEKNVQKKTEDQNCLAVWQKAGVLCVKECEKP